jgi:Kef-type K+ transport system membrane component KefB
MHAEGWKILLDLLLMLVGALAAGLVCERIGISSILGYLAAGVALGPSALKLIASSGEIALIAEIGVALLLFARTTPVSMYVCLAVTSSASNQITSIAGIG